MALDHYLRAALGSKYSDDLDYGLVNPAHAPEHSERGEKLELGLFEYGNDKFVVFSKPKQPQPAPPKKQPTAAAPPPPPEPKVEAKKAQPPPTKFPSAQDPRPTTKAPKTEKPRRRRVFERTKDGGR